MKAMLWLVRLQLDGKYGNQTCGLCGDPMQKSIFENMDIPHAEIEYGNAYKVEGPNEDCPDVLPYEMSCSNENNVKCENELSHEKFSSCHELIEVDPFIHACALDLCHSKSCPQNMQYEECGSPCSNSCSDPERENSCDEHCIEGCFCQEGLIYDDISSHDCIKPQECPCTYNDKIYSPGKSYSTACRICKCFEGKWNCTANPCSATCSVEGGAHINTFDQLRYSVYGDCQYVIVKVIKLVYYPKDVNSFFVAGERSKSIVHVEVLHDELSGFLTMSFTLLCCSFQVTTALEHIDNALSVTTNKIPYLVTTALEHIDNALSVTTNKIPYLNSSNLYSAKIHKSKDQPPGRPIVNGIESLTSRMGQYIDFFIQPPVQNTRAYLKDTKHILQLLDSVPVAEGTTLLATADVTSLYTIVGHHDACHAIKWLLRKYSNMMCKQRKYLTKCLEFCLKFNYFWHNQIYYKQAIGIAMGAKFAPSIANAFMAQWEESAIYEHMPAELILYKRYIDDVIILWNGNKASLEHFMETLNKNEKNIKLVWKIDTKEVDFLDLNVSLEGNRIITKTYFKTVDTNSYLSVESCHHKPWLYNIPKGQLVRLKRNCTKEEDFNEQAQFIGKRFEDKGYDISWLKEQVINVQKLDRKHMLENKTANKVPPNNGAPSLILDYNVQHKEINKLIQRHWHVLLGDKDLQTILPKKPNIIYKRAPTLRDLLVKSDGFRGASSPSRLALSTRYSWSWTPSGKCYLKRTLCPKDQSTTLAISGFDSMAIKVKGPDSESYVVCEPAEHYYIFNASNIGMQVIIQLKPIMQLYIVLDPSFKNQSCGLCGNFNGIQRDDMKTISGVIEGTAPAFVNTWKVSALCRNIDYVFEDSCAINVESSEYAKFWCEQISDPNGDFSPCHGAVEPLAYKQKLHTNLLKCIQQYRALPTKSSACENCIADTCSCAKLEDCMCAAILSYVKICAAKGVFLSNWKLSPCACVPPMVFANCSTSNTGAECAKSCQTLDMQCYLTRCVPGCVCPPGLVSYEKGGCIPEDQCPCYHNTAAYKSGEEIQIRCNTCVCKNRQWKCTTRTCLATCIVYGNGHYITFDGKRYIFNGECQYTLAQDQCSLSKNTSTVRIVTQNVPCGNMGATCSKSIKVFLEDYELILVDDHLNVAQSGTDSEVPYRVRLMGIYLVIETKKGLLIFWDKKSSIFIKVTSEYKGTLCGLCGTYDENRNNDFTTRNNAVVANTEEFANSWRLSPTCAVGTVYRDACSLNPYRNAWANKKCSIINSEVFSTCHTHVDPSNYFHACVSDSCACNTGGDCECFCTAVAAYAQACGEYNICVPWRSPSICPLFCDYYNSKSGQDCEWHYRPCGAPCLKTCRNPMGTCYYEIRGLEGCYPECPKDRPYFDEDEMKCVAACGCYDKDRKHYHLGAYVPSRKNCDYW
ncbi:uncharacterized protein LOC120916795 [Rana temporaria]|uniref:uncharacterized protein LOC120916795 n=1 Tax=Rana temporaria TaxID=8407 RepID=UPI001AACDEB3|nr:uncharacterized protein LOC120916795 [Rana temporaria]